MPFRIPKDEETLFHFGEAPQEGLPGESLRVLIWNIWKGRLFKDWQRDFAALSADRDLILLQEAVTAPEMVEIFHGSKGRHEWHMAASFLWNRVGSHNTGVVTGAVAKPRERKFLRGSERELFWWTPKVSLGTLFGIQDREDSILVINTHVVNFTTTGSFVRFIEELVSLIEHHQGPLILAGDFNTWNFKRWHSLLKILARLDVLPIDFHADPRVLRLDHVFVRGFEVQEATVLSNIRSSDHFPLQVRLKYR